MRCMHRCHLSITAQVTGSNPTENFATCPQAALKQSSGRNQELTQQLKQATRVQQQLAPRLKTLTETV